MKKILLIMRNLFLLLFLFLLFSKNLMSEDKFHKLMVAKPSMPDSRFKETVIFMLYHNEEEGAAGLVVNKPIAKISIIELLRDNNIALPEKIVQNEIMLYWGGPVHPEHIFFIHSSDYNSSNPIFSNNELIVTRSVEILLDIATNNGPKKYIILSGIASWSPGQLDFEINQDGWDKKINSYISIFDNENQMWNRIINSKNI